MMRKLVLGIVLALLFVCFACEGIFVKSDPGNSPVVIFDLLWQDFDKTYPSFENKRINWDSIYNLNRYKISDNSTKEDLFYAISDMLATLKDGHVNLYTNFGKSFKYDFAKDKPANFIGVSGTVSKYVSGFQNNNTIGYGSLYGAIGYIYISSFGAASSDYDLIDRIIKTFGNKDGIIIDLRNNGGGSTNNANRIAGKFTSEKVVGSYFRYKSGPYHKDLTDFIPAYNSPLGSEQFTKPVILLTNRRCFSATEYFVLQMKALVNVKVVGDTTGGGAGNPVYRELPNGWSYRVPRGLAYKSDKSNYDGVGLFPDFPVWITDTEMKEGRDLILEKAIELLQ